MRTKLALIATLLACHSNNNKAVDAPNATIDAAIDATTNACASYTMATVATMRTGAPGCYELDNVVAVALTPSTSSPVVFVEDSAGGDFSAIDAHCSSASTVHPCTVSAMVAATAIGHSVTLKGTYIKASSKYEVFYIDMYTDNGAGTLPAAAAVTLADIQRGSTSYKYSNQRVTLQIPNNDPLVMYDFTPSDLSRTATACPYVFGFGMIPNSAGATATAACMNGTTQPTGQATPSAMEVLIDTRFYKGFTTSSDCRCAKSFMDMEPSATSKVTGTLQGILQFTVPFMATTGFMVLAPTAVSDAPLTNTVAGM